MLTKLLRMIRNPETFFDEVRNEGWHEPFLFLLQASAAVAFFTAIVNYMGVPSTDVSSSYQAQIIGWRITSEMLLPRFGNWAYVLDGVLILTFALIIAVLLAGFVHAIFRTLGGRGPILNAWKATCYGAGPCVLLGWVPYWTFFVGAWSFVLQLYYGPKILYRMGDERALPILAVLLGATLLEFAARGTTVTFPAAFP